MEELRQAMAEEFTAFSEYSRSEECINNGLFKASWSNKLCDFTWWQKFVSEQIIRFLSVTHKFYNENKFLCVT